MLYWFHEEKDGCKFTGTDQRERERENVIISAEAEEFS
jgi:hypothetical protein